MLRIPPSHGTTPARQSLLVTLTCIAYNHLDTSIIALARYHHTYSIPDQFMCMFRLTPDPDGDFRAPARLASRPSTSRPASSSSSSRRPAHNSNPFRPLPASGIPLLTNTYVPAMPRRSQDYIEAVPRNLLTAGSSAVYTTVTPSSVRRHQYEEVVPGGFNNVVRMPSTQSPSIPTPSPNLSIPPASADIPVPSPSVQRQSAASGVPPAAPDPPPAVQPRRGAAARTSASTSPPEASPPTRTEQFNLQVPPRARHSRTGSQGNHSSSSHTGSSRGHSRSGSAAHSSNGARSEGHTSPPTTPRSGTSRGQRRVEESREQPMNFQQPEARRERIEYVEGGRRVRKYYFPS